MNNLLHYKAEIARLYWDDGLSYQEIGDRYGKSREAVRQFLYKHFPYRVKGWEFRQKLQSEKKRRSLTQEALHREANAVQCVVCGDLVIRSVPRDGINQTCSPECAGLWRKARYWLDPNVKEKHRLSHARSILKNQAKRSPATVAWARRVVNGTAQSVASEPDPNSQAGKAFAEVQRIRNRKRATHDKASNYM